VEYQVIILKNANQVNYFLRLKILNLFFLAPGAVEEGGAGVTPLLQSTMSKDNNN
jgi:hypothetical protein